MYYLAGRDVAIGVTFEVNGDPVIPTVDSVTYTLRDHGGAEIAGQVDVPVTTDGLTTQVTIVLPASVNGIAALLERRTLFVQWSQGSIPRTTRQTYWLHHWLNHSVTPDQVRTFIGINATELPDEDIDLVRAYFKVDDKIGNAAFTAALAGNPDQLRLAEGAILGQAVLDLEQSLRTRIAQRMTDGMIGFDRPAIRDFNRVIQRARDLIDEAVSQIGGAAQTDTPIVLFGQRTDVITGA